MIKCLIGTSTTEYLLIEKGDLLDLIYPIGCIYDSDRNMNPGSTLGGTWTAMGARVLVGYESTKNWPGKTDGNETVTLQTSNLPAHSHAQQMGVFKSSTGNVKDCSSAEDVDKYAVGTSQGLETGMTGTGEPFSIMQPYEVVYRWKRTA